ncbi:MAG: acetate--CoA ligase [Acidobacteria bacterium]|nr:acetate--CoA ligase [Acidobacteriota bacterium]
MAEKPREETPEQEIEVLLDEQRAYPPPEGFRRQAWVQDASIYREAAADPEAFWAAQAERLEWSRRWDRVLDWKPPFARWFVGGKLNASVNCLDRHLANGRGDRPAILWEGEPGDRKTLTYADLHREVCRFTNVLRGLGVRKGDRVAIYLPMIPELPVAMLACARIGAPHSVVFAGFSAQSLRDRINDAEARVLITADGGHRRGGIVPLKAISDEALEDAPSITGVVMVRRTGEDVPMVAGRDHDWAELMAEAADTAEPEEMDAEDILYILYTSGTTGKPKGIVHSTGGYLTQVTATARAVFDLKDSDIWWAAADIGWVTGHSYIVYGPMALGVTQVMYEGAPDTPTRARLWSIVERYRVTCLYTAPTAIRAFMKWGAEHPASHDLGSLRLLGTVGEPINPEAWVWYHREIGGGRCPIVDTWWQTETGAVMATPLPGVTTLKPGSATHAFPGISLDILDRRGERAEVGGGLLAITRPWPSMLRGIWGDEARFRETYWSQWKDIYFPADGARRDEDGYFWVMGRVDDVLNVSGHRLGAAEVESALVEHEAVAEAAVVGRPHEIKGEGIAAFVVLRESASTHDGLAAELKAHVARAIGPIARPDDIVFAADVPKTRSGKIMRRLLRDIAAGKAIGDTTTLADPAVVHRLREEYDDED